MRPHEGLSPFLETHGRCSYSPSSSFLHYISPLQLREVLQEFCALMGEHFTVLADKEEKQASSKHTPLISEASASGTNYDVTVGVEWCSSLHNFLVL